MNQIENILDKSLHGGRLSPKECLALFTSKEFTSLGMVADAVCIRMHPENYRTYIIDRNINYTNICTSGCKFCAFYREEGDSDGYVIPLELLFQKIEETLALGGPSWHQSRTAFTSSSSPSNNASTLPSSLFFTQPLTLNLLAISLVWALKKTPCTRPSMVTCARAISIYAENIINPGQWQGAAESAGRTGI